MDAAFYHDTFKPPPTGHSVPPSSCLSANSMSADTLLPFLYTDHAPQPRTTQEQEGFADGFVRALASLHQQGGGVSGGIGANGGSSVSSAGGVICASVTSNLCSAIGGLSSSRGDISFSSASGGSVDIGPSNLSGGTLVYTNLAANCHAPQHHKVTTAYQPVPGGISMTTAYQANADVSERKKLRNRIAASRCRHRKLERIARLEERVRVLRSLNGRLVAKATRLHGQVGALRSRAAKHLTGGCQIAMVNDGEGIVVQSVMEEEVMAHTDHVPHISGYREGKQEH